MVRFSPKTHESDGLGTDSRGMKGGQPPEEREIWGKFFDPAPKQGIFREISFSWPAGQIS